MSLLAQLLEKVPPFKKAMMAARMAYDDGDVDKCKQFLGMAALEVTTDVEQNVLADFVKEKGLII